MPIWGTRWRSVWSLLWASALRCMCCCSSGPAGGCDEPAALFLMGVPVGAARRSVFFCAALWHAGFLAADGAWQNHAAGLSNRPQRPAIHQRLSFFSPHGAHYHCGEGVAVCGDHLLDPFAAAAIAPGGRAAHPAAVRGAHHRPGIWLDPHLRPAAIVAHVDPLYHGYPARGGLPGALYALYVPRG